MSEEDQSDDGTIVRRAVRLIPPSDEELTVVAPLRRNDTSSGGEARPIPEPELSSFCGSREELPRLDPRRIIVPAPGAAPWDAPAVGERGLVQGLPVRYGARSVGQGSSGFGTDAVHEQLGPAPEGQTVGVKQQRETLPSLRRRDKKRGLITLLSYVAAVLLSALGLWGVAALAFGW